MAYKRKRNVKVDHSQMYPVYKPGSFDVSSLEEYIPPSLDTGMEADEEKELHLKKIMEGEKGSIPIPIMVEVNNPARQMYGKYIPRRRYVEWAGDAENEYLLDHRDEEACRELGMSREEFCRSMCMVEREQSPAEGGEKLTKMISSRILIRSERFSPLAYVCFRKRIIKPSRRSRRSEELSKEKVERIWRELHLLGVLCDFYCKRNRLERALESVESDLFRTSCILMKNNTRKVRRRIARKMVNRQHVSPKGGANGTSGGIGDIVFDRTRIRLLRQRIREAKQRIHVSEYDAEIQAFRRHNEMYRM
ncbi:hypothetical protein M970_061100 [Encephalitozoon cuniculi EcunIII-L]|nr:hypothetical protein M970_061100 [Encephalitozoon cuniculi EcunIII-L]